MVNLVGANTQHTTLVHSGVLDKHPADSWKLNIGMARLSITASALSVSSLKPKPEKENKIRHRLVKVKAVRTA